MNTGPIGIFDSGIGGTSIWKEIALALPQEDTLYLADSKNAPYGEKSKEDILQLSIKNTEWLLQRDCKLIVVACNTATTNAIDHLRKTFGVPFIGIEPAIKPAALGSRTKKVGVLATKGTLASSLFHSTAQLYASGIEVMVQEGKGLVELLETGQLHSQEMEVLLKTYIDPMVASGMDYLVLGCTHYPYLVPKLQQLLPTTVTIMDSGSAVAKQTQKVLTAHRLLNPSAEAPQHEFYTNTQVAILSSFLADVNPPVVVRYLDF